MTDRFGPSPSALARKYRALAALRARRDDGGAGATREELRILAAEFPGCLRELDTLGAAELARRAAVCAEPEPSAEAEPWITWIAAYHALMGQALEARARRGSGGGPDPGDDAFLQAALAPPGGRINVVVLRELSTRFGVPAATIAGTLFPVRRPSPYRL
jgi:hypothetical protein